MDMNNRIKTVMHALINSGYVDSQMEFGEALGYTNKSSFSQLINGKVAMPKNIVSRIIDVFPIVNREWLTDENGSMFKDGNFEIKINKKQNRTSSQCQTEDNMMHIINEYQDQIKTHLDHIDRLISIIEKMQNNNQ